MRILSRLAASAVASVSLAGALNAQVPPKSAAPTVVPAAAPASPDGVLRDGYMVGLGDVLDVVLVGVDDFKARVTVQSDGTIQLPFIGTIKAQDKTLLNLGKEIASGLEKGGYYVNPAIQVTLAQTSSRYVTVLGSVGNPGLIPVERPYRVSEIIARVGGIKPDGGETFYLRTDKGVETPLTLEQIARGGEAADPIVNPGDKIYVPEAPTFYVYGQVNGAGTYPIRKNMTLRMALARSGGLTSIGSTGRISVFRKGVELKKFDLSDLIQPDDVIEVGERFF